MVRSMEMVRSEVDTVRGGYAVGGGRCPAGGRAGGRAVLQLAGPWAGIVEAHGRLTAPTIPTIPQTRTHSPT